MRTIRKRRGGGRGKAQLGVYADVAEPGTVRLGDAAEALDLPAAGTSA